MPGAHLLGHALDDAAVLEHHVMGRYLARRRGEARQRLRPALHPGVVQQDHVRRAVLARVLIGRGDDVGDDEGIRLEGRHKAGTLSGWQQQILKFKGR